MARTSIAQALAEAQIKHEMQMQEPGVEQPPEMNALQALSQVGQGYGMGQMGGAIANALATKGVPALQGLGEAGYTRIPQFNQVPEEGFILPEGMKKADMLTDAERQYRNWANTYEQYAANDDFQGLLRAKWGLLKNAGGN